MGEDERFETLAGATTSFSQLLFGDENDGVSIGGSIDSTRVFDCGRTPKMLCFGESALISETTSYARSSLTCSDSSSSPSSANVAIGAISKSDTRKRGGVGKESEKSVGNANQRVCCSKKTKTEGSNAPIKRKEKLGERIAALQQLVSPFGKSDTASVLHEAMGYIRFLQEQLQLLCSPYLQRSLPLSEKEGSESAGFGKDLRSRGLCLVPVECTVHVAETNGADFWSPSMAGNFTSSPTTTAIKQ